MNVDQPPRKLSEWFGQAIADTQACAADPNYRIDMGSWHLGTQMALRDPEQPPVCLVCMAGSLLSQTFQTKPTETWGATDDDSVPRDVAWLMRAINHLRLGDLLNGFRAATFSELCLDRDVLLDRLGYGIDLLMRVDCSDPNRWETPPHELGMSPFLRSMVEVLDRLLALGV